MSGHERAPEPAVRVEGRVASGRSNRATMRVERGRFVESVSKTGDSADVPFREILIEVGAAIEETTRTPLYVGHVPRAYFPIECRRVIEHRMHCS